MSRVFDPDIQVGFLEVVMVTDKLYGEDDPLYVMAKERTMAHASKFIPLEYLDRVSVIVFESPTEEGRTTFSWKYNPGDKT